MIASQDPARLFSNKLICAESIVALGRIGEASSPAVPTLIKLIDSDDTTLRRNAICALGRIGRPAAAGVPILIDRIKHPKTFEPEAVRALMWIDPSTRPMVQRFVEKATTEFLDSGLEPRRIWMAQSALGDDCPEVEWVVNSVIDDIEVTVLPDGVETKQLDWLEYVRQDFDYLIDLRRGAKQGVQRLEQFAKISHPIVRRWAIEVIRSVTN
jgi:HEAT repeats